tara:strand:- start:84283 stop:84756 length:474 start_codon:yes stop_codon:yes gene_type:complete
MQKVPMTVEGEKALQEELEELLVLRGKISIAIGIARELGDLKENAEYHAAREQQGITEARIRDIEAKLSNVQVIDVTKLTNTGKVIFGSTVTLFNLDDESEMRYKLVGEDEADLAQQKISVTSPIARGVVGKNEGDEVDITTPAGHVAYEISKVEYI